MVSGALGRVVTLLIGLVNHANLRDKATIGADLSPFTLLLHQSIHSPTLRTPAPHDFWFRRGSWLIVVQRGLPLPFLVFFLRKQSCPDIDLLLFLSGNGSCGEIGLKVLWVVDFFVNFLSVVIVGILDLIWIVDDFWGLGLLVVGVGRGFSLNELMTLVVEGAVDR